MSISIKLNVFEGPLDLLLHLIDKNKLNIYDIPITLIADQYLEHIRLMEENKMEVMSEFIEMAAILINIKAKMLLPAEESEEEESGDPRAELIEKLLEYRQFKLISQQLKEQQLKTGKLFFKEATIPDAIVNDIPKPDPDKLLQDIDFSMMYTIFQSVMKKKKDSIDPIRSKFGEIKKNEFSIDDKMSYIRKIGSQYKTFSFRDLLLEQVDKENVIVTFLAVLELIKSSEVEIHQESIFDDIYIKFIGSENNGVE